MTFAGKQSFPLALAQFVCGALLLSLGLSMFSACGKSRAREDQSPAPSSALTKAEALALGAQWQLADPARRSYCEVQPTGSMAPIFDSRCILLLEKVAAAELRPADIGLYARAAGSAETISHRVIEVRPSAVLFDGDNNQGSDGWIPADRIRWRVAGIIFTQR